MFNRKIEIEIEIETETETEIEIEIEIEKKGTIMIEKGKNISIIDENIKITGTITSQSQLIVKGNVRGKLNIDSLTIAKGGKASADIRSATVIIGGDFEGEIRAKKEVTVLSGGKCTGNVTSKDVIIERGAIINATIRQRLESNLLEIQDTKKLNRNL